MNQRKWLLSAFLLLCTSGVALAQGDSIEILSLDITPRSSPLFPLTPPGVLLLPPPARNLWQLDSSQVFDWTVRFRYSLASVEDPVTAAVAIHLIRTDTGVEMYSNTVFSIANSKGLTITTEGTSLNKMNAAFTTPRKADLRDPTSGLSFYMTIQGAGRVLAKSAATITVEPAPTGAEVTLSEIQVDAAGFSKKFSPGTHRLDLPPGTSFSVTYHYRYRSITEDAELDVGTYFAGSQVYSTSQRVTRPLPVSVGLSEPLVSPPLPAVTPADGSPIELFLLIQHRGRRDLLAYSPAVKFTSEEGTDSVTFERLSLTQTLDGHETTTEFAGGDRKIFAATPSTKLSANVHYGYRYNTQDDVRVHLKVTDLYLGIETMETMIPIANPLPKDPKAAVGQLSKTLEISVPESYGGFRFVLRLEHSGTGKLLAESESIELSPEDPKISAVEPIQVVQDGAQSIPMVAGKATLVRVFFEGPEYLELSAFLEGFRGGQSLGRISPRSRFRQAAPAPAPDRDDPNGSVNFVLPPAWTQAGELRIVAEIEEESLEGFDDPSNNTREKTINFHALPGFRIGYRSICVRTEYGELCPSEQSLMTASRLLEKMFPAADGHFWYSDTKLFGSKTVISGHPREECDNILVCIDAADLVRVIARQTAEAKLFGRFDNFVFWLPSDSYFTPASSDLLGGVAENLLGQGTLFAMQVEGFDEEQLALQVGFVQRLLDKNSDAWPSEGAGINTVLVGSEHDGVGWNVGTLQFKPGTTLDFMNFHRTRPSRVWISALNYDLLARLRAGLGNEASLEVPPGLKARSYLQRATTSRPVALISGSFSANGSTAAIDSVVQLLSDSDLAVSEDGPYCVEIRGEAPQRTCLGTDSILSVEPPVVPFTVALPVPANLTSIALTFNGQDVTVVSPSLNPPTINITAPQAGAHWNGGAQVISWTANDPDGDPLEYTVLGSLDNGATWSPIVSGLTGMSLTLQADLAPSSTEVLIRVLASDGFHTAEAMVGPLSIETHPAISVTPQTVPIGLAVVGDQANGAVPVTNSGTGVLTITGLSSDNPAFEIDPLPNPFEIGAGLTYPVPIRYVPAAVGTDVGTLNISGNAGDNPYQVTLQGTGVDASTATIYVSTRSQELGNRFVGQAASGTVTITNPSEVDLNVTLEIAGAGFTLPSSAPFLLSAGSQRAIEVQFMSAAVGEFAGTLTIRSNAENEPTIAVAVSAKALEAPVQPVIPASNGVVNGATFRPEIAAGSWVTIFGQNFSERLLLWTDYIVNGALPTRLGGVEVFINGKPAAIWFINPTQINVQAPADSATGTVEVVVVVNGIASDPVQVEMKTYSPGFFRFDPEGQKYLAAVHSDGTFLGKDDLFGGALATRPVKSGDAVLLFGTGFGMTSPPTPSGVIPPAAPTAAPVRITIGGVDATVAFSGIAGVGLYQFNVTIPDGLSPGDAEVIAEVGGVRSPPGAFISIAP